MTSAPPMRSLIKQPQVSLTEYGFGAAQLGNLYRETSDDEAFNALRSAWDSGIRYFDTAPHYGLGLSEFRLGEVLQEYPRAEYVISSKVGRLLEPSPEMADQLDDHGFVVPAAWQRRFDFSRTAILRSVEESLIRLNSDYLDIAYLHDPDDHWGQASTEGIDTLIALREQGVVRAIGAGMNQSSMLTRLARDYDVDVLMCAGRYTLLDQEAAADLLPTALANDVSIVIAGVYNSGLLSQPQVPDSAKFDYQQAPEKLLEKARSIAQIAERYGNTLPEVALAFVRAHPAVISTVVGVRTPSQVTQTIERASVEISPQLWEELKSAELLPPLAVTPPPSH